jgi:hypothetical protein
VPNFEWFVAIALCIIIAALFNIAHAIRGMSKVITEVVIGLVTNVRAKPIAVRSVTEEETQEEED